MNFLKFFRPNHIIYNRSFSGHKTLTDTIPNSLWVPRLLRIFAWSTVSLTHAFFGEQLPDLLERMAWFMEFFCSS